MMEHDAQWYYKEFKKRASEKDFESAKRNFETAIQLQPTNTKYRLEHGQLMYNAENYVEARLDYETVVDNSHDEDELFEAYSKLSYLGERLKDTDLVVRSLDWIINNDLHSEFHLLRRGDALLISARYADAIRDYSDALKVTPDRFRTLLSRAEAYFKQGEYQMVIQDTSTIITYDNLPLIIQEYTYHWRGFAYYKLSMEAESISDANQVMIIRGLNQVELAADYYENLAK